MLVVLALLVVQPIFVVGQSKKNKKKSIISRIYHNTTARYNGYYNSTFRINSAAKSIIAANKDDFQELLPYYPFIDSVKSRSVAPDLDEVVKKTSAVVQIHSKSKWVDDCYFLLGKAYFVKNDFENALQAFLYVTTEYKINYPKKSKSKKGKKIYRKFKRKQNLMKVGLAHKPIYYKTIIWLIHTYIELGQLEDAQSVLDLMQTNEHFPAKYMDELMVLRSHLYLQRDDLPNAAKYLEEAISLKKRGQLKVRYTYIVAQLYQMMNDNSKAVASYSKVLKMNAPYEMEFYSKLNVAKLYQDDGSIPIASVKKKLLKLAKDEKNIEFLDQIYYLLADLEVKDENAEEAIKYLLLSVKYSVSSVEQKTKSYLRLADLYFDGRNYTSAKTYYDTTLMFMNNVHKDFSFLTIKAEVLGDLVLNLDIIQEQDSLRYIAGLPQKERDAFIKKIIDKKRKEIEKARQEEEEQSFVDFTQENTPKIKPDNSTSSVWYFYNNSIKSIGYNEYVKKWGNRQLGDDWRRSDKAATTVVTDQGNEDSAENTVQEIDEAIFKIEYYYEDLPLTEADMERSDDLLIEAFFNVGILFHEKLYDYKLASESFEELIKRYPSNKHLLQSYYILYSCNKELNNTQKENYYKNLLITKYPNSTYTKIITDPNYVDASKQAINELLELYEESYEYYRNEEYREVITASGYAEDLFPSNYLMPKFEFLKALSYGKLGDISSYKSVLTNIISDYPEAEVTPEAEDLLNYLNSQVGEDSTATDEIIASIYDYKLSEKHYMVIIVKDEHGKFESLKNGFADYNEMYYSLDQLSVSTRLLNRDNKMVLVQGFNDGTQALEYYKFVLKDKSLFQEMVSKSYDVFIFSINNFKTFVVNREIETYATFFDQHYKK